MTTMTAGAAAVAPRSKDALGRALAEEKGDWRYRYLWMPMLVVQGILYTRVVARFLWQPTYRSMPTPEHPLLRENHIGNLVSLKSMPNMALLGIHVFMAWCWIAGTLAQKYLARRMGEAIGMSGAGFARYRRIHVTVGWSLLVIGFVGIAVAPLIALANHGNPPMKWFLVGQIVTFFPPMTMVLVTARDRRRSIRAHRFWAEFAFVGPAVASVWTEAAIYVTGRMTSLGPDSGEIWSSVVGGAMGFLFVVGPAWMAWRRGVAADSARSST